MNAAVAQSTASSTNPNSADFQREWPRFTTDGGVPIEYEVAIVSRGEIPSGTVLRATIDDSTQYQADGKCWRAVTSCPGIKAGQRLENNWHVSGWREVSGTGSKA